jgi:predicted GTPase
VVRTGDARRKIVILGAAGRDFHNFNVVYRADFSAQVVAFTATQIEGIADRRYPFSLAGPLYPEGIPIVAESQLEELCTNHAVDEVVFAYSDVLHQHVMHLASRALAAGASFSLLGPKRTMLVASRPVIAVTAVRTGCGKSSVTRWLGERLRAKGLRVAVLRHPMPYGELASQRLQRFGSLADLDAGACSIEEREEYEPHIAAGNVVFAGIDYAAILAAAEKEADMLLWDGGNNDFPFVRPDLHIALADAMRPDQVDTHHPGETVARAADVLLISKTDSADDEIVRRIEIALRALNAGATIIHGASPIVLDDAKAVAGRRVLAIEDGPTITHGDMPNGAAYRAAQAAGARQIVDPRPFATPEIGALYRKYPHIGRVLPAVGYSAQQLRALEATINAADADVVVSGTPADLGAQMRINKPIVRARYSFAEVGEPKLSSRVDEFLSAWRR